MSTAGKLKRVYRKIYRRVEHIPEGTVATYGQIARMVGVGPRQVGQALAALPPGSKCPWHRVINARGRISIRSGMHKAHLDQERRLKAEGVVFRNGSVDLEVYRWHPEV